MNIPAASRSKLSKAIAPGTFMLRSNRRREHLFGNTDGRFMTTSKRVQDRSRWKRIHDLEIATEKWKIVSKLIAIIEILKQEEEMIIPARNLEQHRRRINLPKPHSVVNFLQKSPKIFELYRDQKGNLWCGLTKEGEDLVEEEERLIEEHSDRAAECVCKCLMMSIDKRLAVDKLANFRRDFGLPIDFRKKWVHAYPNLFKIVKNMDETEQLELVTWNPEWAVTELEKKKLGESKNGVLQPGILSMPFPLKFPASYKRVYRYAGKIGHFQKRSYLSPYADATELQPGSMEFDKRAVAIMHEILTFTIEKRLVTDHLTHFKREFNMPQKLMRLLLKHFGVFYVSERGKRFSVFLTEAYHGSELTEKAPLFIWREKLLSQTGYRSKRNSYLLQGETCGTQYDLDEDQHSVEEEAVVNGDGAV